MAELLNDIISHIIDNHLATTKDVDIFKNYSPDSPDTCTMVYEYTGSAPAPFTDMSVRSIQIVCRDKSTTAASAKCWALYMLMHQPTGFITIQARKCLIAMRNTPVKIDVDEQNRVLWAFNIALTTNFN